MNTLEMLERIQAEGPDSHSASDYDKWYNKILLAANGILRIEAVLGEEEQAQTVGNYNPHTKTWEGGKHEKLVDLTEEK